MPALPSSVLEPLWVQFHALLPARQVHHPLGCHRPRIPDRVVFSKLPWKLSREGHPQWLVVIGVIGTDRYVVQYPDGATEVLGPC